MNRIIILESPYAGDVSRNVHYARRAMRDSILRGEAPFASHLLYTQPGILNDKLEFERTLGINLGYSFWKNADRMVVYIDYGISPGMKKAVELWSVRGIPIEYRKIGKAESLFQRIVSHMGFACGDVLNHLSK